MQAYRTAKGAYAAAGDAPVLVISTGGETLYVVGIEKMTEISVITGTITRTREDGSAIEGITPGRYVSGFIAAGHLDRLGNGNAAAGERYLPNAPRAFPGDGLLVRYQKDADQIRYDNDLAARRAAKAKD